jgi:hypothetical protein
MDRRTYDEYLARFNARDYEAVLSYYAPRFEIAFAGYAFRTREAVRSFYGFLHQYVSESILIDAFVSSERMIALEARVRLEGVRALSPEAARQAGFEKLMVPAPGQTIEIPQFIHYHLEDGKFVKAFCAVFEPAR